MEKNNVGRLIAADGRDSNILYGGGFKASDEFIYFEDPEGKRHLVVSALELSRAKTEANSDVTVIDYGDFMKKYPRDARPPMLAALTEFAMVDGWIVPPSFPVGYADMLREKGYTVTVAEGDFFPQRTVKRSDELEKIREMERITQDAMMMVRDMIISASVNCHNMLVRKDGEILTSEYLRCEVEAEFKRKFCSAEHTIIAGGCDGAAPHCTGSGPIYAHTPVVCDIFPRSDIHGYWGDMTRTFCKGSAAPVVKRAFDSVLKASEKALAMLRAGVTGETVHNCAARSMESDGFMTYKNANGDPCGFFHGLGHGVGLDIHEQPRLSPANKSPLPVNAVVSVEPGLYDPEWGGIRLEDLVAVTEDGYENFCTMEKELELP